MKTGLTYLQGTFTKTLCVLLCAMYLAAPLQMPIITFLHQRSHDFFDFTHTHGDEMRLQSMLNSFEGAEEGHEMISLLKELLDAPQKDERKDSSESSLKVLKKHFPVGLTVAVFKAPVVFKPPNDTFLKRCIQMTYEVPTPPPILFFS